METSFSEALALYSALFFTALTAGAMVMFAAGVAPLVHKVLESADASKLTRAIFPVYYLLLSITAALAAVGAFLVNTAAGLVLAVIAGGFLFARQVMTPRINALNDEVKRGSTVAQGPAKMLHAWSVRMNMLQLLVLLVVFWFLALSA